MENRISGLPLPEAHAPPPSPIKVGDTIEIDESLTAGRQLVYVAVAAGDVGAVTRVAIGLENENKSKQGELL